MAYSRYWSGMRIATAQPGPQNYAEQVQMDATVNPGTTMGSDEMTGRLGGVWLGGAIVILALYYVSTKGRQS